MTDMFACDDVDPADVCGIFNQPIGSWDVSKLYSARGMFSGNPYFNQDIGSWDVSSVNDMADMFADATAFNQNVSLWDVSGVANMNYMFFGATSFTNQDLSGWKISHVMLCQGTDVLVNTGSGNIPPNFADFQACFGI